MLWVLGTTNHQGKFINISNLMIVMMLLMLIHLYNLMEGPLLNLFGQNHKSLFLKK